MLPDFLRYLRNNNYRVVHIVAAPTKAKSDGAPKSGNLSPAIIPD
jgi:hypothetical protein